MTRPSVKHAFALLIMAVVFCLLLSPAAHAKKWQLMLLPGSHSYSHAKDLITVDNTVDNTDDRTELSAGFSDFHTTIEQGISRRLVQELHTVVASERVFADCRLEFCGYANAQEALKTVALKAPEVELVLFYSLQKRSMQENSPQENSLQENSLQEKSPQTTKLQNPSLENPRLESSVENNVSTTVLNVILIDPVSYQQYESFSLNILGSEEGMQTAQLRSLAQDIGGLVNTSLQQSKKRSEFDLNLRGFLLEEITPFSTFILSQALDTRLTLTKSEKQAESLISYLPTMNIQFRVSSSLTQSQFSHLMQRFFEQQDIRVISEYGRESNRFDVARIGNPYMPSLVSTLFAVCLCILLGVILVKRQIYHYKLEQYAQSKAVQRWLEVYKKAKRPWFLLQNKWHNQHSYWLRLSRESSDLEKQASLFFEAGDVISAKLFISKTLNINSDAALANALVKKIAEQESSQKELSEKEQRVRNKIAKAMNSYRGKQAIKALRQTYQALHASAGEKKLRRQHKAIKRLIQKISQDFASAIYHIELTDLNTGETCVLTAGGAVNIGRAAGIDADPETRLLSLDNSLDFQLNYKALSRMGKHCKLTANENGFFIEDLGSTNGTFVGSEQVKHENGPRALLNNDSVYLGASSELTAVKLHVAIDSMQTLMHLRIDKQLQHTLDMASLARMWPDYVRAMRSSLVMLYSSCVLALDIQNDALVITTELSCQNNANYRALVRLSLSEFANVCPLVEEQQNDINGAVLALQENAQAHKDENCSENRHVYYNNEPLLGQVPLILPCELKYKHHHIALSDAMMQGANKHIDILGTRSAMNTALTNSSLSPKSDNGAPS